MVIIKCLESIPSDRMFRNAHWNTDTAPPGEMLVRFNKVNIICFSFHVSSELMHMSTSKNRKKNQTRNNLNIKIQKEKIIKLSEKVYWVLSAFKSKTPMGHNVHQIHPWPHCSSENFKKIIALFNLISRYDHKLDYGVKTTGHRYGLGIAL